MSIANERLCKQPSENLKFRMKFASRLDSSETIYSISSITSETRAGETSDLSISDSGIESGTSINFWIASGTSGESYRVEVKVVTTASQTMEGDGILQVRDK